MASSAPRKRIREDGCGYAVSSVCFIARQLELQNGSPLPLLSADELAQYMQPTMTPVPSIASGSRGSKCKSASFSSTQSPSSEINLSPSTQVVINVAKGATANFSFHCPPKQGGNAF